MEIYEANIKKDILFKLMVTTYYKVCSLTKRQIHLSIYISLQASCIPRCVF